MREKNDRSKLQQQHSPLEIERKFVSAGEALDASDSQIFS